MNDRRSRIAPPEMMNGSTRGSVSSNSSALETSIRQIEEMQLAAPPVDRSLLLEAPQLGNETGLRVKHELVQRALGARSSPGRVLVERELKVGVQLHRLASRLGIGEHVASGANASRAAQSEKRRPVGLAPEPGETAEDAQIALEQIGAAVRHALLDVEQPVEAHQRVGTSGRQHHLVLEVIREAGVHQL